MSLFFSRMLRQIMTCLCLLILIAVFASAEDTDEKQTDESGILYKILSANIDQDLKRKLLRYEYLRGLTEDQRYGQDNDMLAELPKRSHMWFRHSPVHGIPIQTRLSFGQPLSRNGIGQIHKIRYGK